MANWYTLSYGLVTRDAVTAAQSEPPTPTVADDPWVYAGALVPRPTVGDHFVDGEYHNDETALSVAQGNKIASLRDACGNHIKFLGFVCSCRFPADSETHPYVFPTEAKDQANILQAMVNSLANLDNEEYAAELWCGIGVSPGYRVPTATDWQIRILAHANIKEVASTLRAHVHDAQEELQIKTDAVLAATTVSAVNAIAWDAPNS
jgi:hypothetical protein